MLFRKKEYPKLVIKIIRLVEIEPTKASLNFIFIELLYGAALYKRVNPKIKIIGGIIPEIKFISQVNSSRENEEFTIFKTSSIILKIPFE